jgi:anti-sigma factor ChrR (cupin superfamily)
MLPDPCFPGTGIRAARKSSFCPAASPKGTTIIPPAWYLRNPPGSSHRPSSDRGAVLFVKLRQMPPDEDRRVRIDSRDPSSWRRRQGRDVCPLFSDRAGQVTLERLDPGTALLASPVAGAEMLVLAGELLADDRRHHRGSWLRLPAGAYPGIVAGAPGVTLYLKIGRHASLDFTMVTGP